MNLQRIAQAARTNPAVALLVLVLVAVNAVSVAQLLTGYLAGVDLEIPLRAATRWLAGGDPYPPEAFNAPNGPDLPFLYPPFVLPLIAPLTFLPRALPFAGWSMLLLASGYLAGRRLGLGPAIAAVALLWPPFIEGIMGGNVQVFLFAVFTVLMYRDGRQLDPSDHGRAAPVEGVLAAFVGALKISQVHPWMYLLRRRPRAAAIGLVVFATIALLTLPLVGVESWVHWVSQAGRSGDPSWPPIGAPLSIFVGQPVALAMSVISLLAVLVVPPRQAGAWVGILTLVGAPSLHMFGLLFLLPAMLLVRREIGLIAAVLVATYEAHAIWIAILVIAWTLLASSRWPILRASAPNPG
jgi:glycosyl transferase family 87